MKREILLKMIEEDNQGLLNLEYELCSGCGARTWIKAKSLRAAKYKANRLGFGICSMVWIRDYEGRLLTRKSPRTNAIWE